MTRIVGPIAAVILALVTWLVLAPHPEAPVEADSAVGLVSPHDAPAGCEPAGAEDRVSLGAFSGKVAFDEEAGYYMLELQGARLPFKTDPKRALEVPLEAPGQGVKERNHALLYGIMGPDVKSVALLVDPAEKTKVMPAVVDLQRYMAIVAQDKLGPLAFTRSAKHEGGDAPPVVRLADATVSEPIIQLIGPDAGANSTVVRVEEGGRVRIEGKTYDDLYAAADMVCMTVVKMLCGSADCPDAAACATGGDCGCG